MKVGVKLQALVYDFLRWRKVPESDARGAGWSVCNTTTELDPLA